jgi:hypothetical protein
MLDRLGLALRNPVLAAYTLRARLDPRGLIRRYARLARAAGIDRLYFVLSFDCDTPQDIEAAWPVHERLTDLGARPVYAVPGELLLQGERVYRRIRDTGAEFLNHGYRQHTYFDEARGEYASCFFYDELPPESVDEDIRRGHETLSAFLGVPPRGFRTPHFGTFQRRSELQRLHATLACTDHAFSSSTTPFHAMRYGPAFRRRGLVELPVSGMGSAPLRILDTWNCFRAPNRRLTPEDYRAEGGAHLDALKAAGAGVLNYYADPCHIRDSDVFFETVGTWLAGAQPISFGELLERLSWSPAS